MTIPQQDLKILITVGLILISGFFWWQAKSMEHFISPQPHVVSNTQQGESTNPTPMPSAPHTTHSETQVIQVASFSYIPLLHGKIDTVNHIEDTYREYDMTKSQVESKITAIESSLVAALAEGSRYHGYANPSAPPALEYQIIDTETFYEPVPLSEKKYNELPLPDYQQMMRQINVCDYVDRQGVREIWLWTYAGTGKAGWESNFSSPTYPDISNSDLDPDDLPICEHSYTVYDYNYGRTVAEALHDHIHQLERLFKYADRELFWGKYVGYFPDEGHWGPIAENTHRRCGWAHFPPNGEEDYDYANQNFVDTDCEDWQPDSTGKTIRINCQRWGCTQDGYFVWWMQNIPGHENTVTSDGKRLRNWWELKADFDVAMHQNQDLFLEE